MDLDHTALGFSSFFDVLSEPHLQHVYDVTNTYFLIWTKMTTARSSRGHGGHPMSAQHRHWPPHGAVQAALETGKANLGQLQSLVAGQATAAPEVPVFAHQALEKP